MLTRKYIWAWVSVILGPFLLLSVGLFFRDDSFGLHKIRPSSGFSSQNGQISSFAEMDNFHSIVSQPFSYLSENKECYLFISKDENYVIKFFKMRRMTPKYWLNYIPLPWLDSKRLRKVGGREKARDEVFKSLQISFEKFRYQSGLIFLHLFRTDYINKRLRVKDSKKMDYYIPLDSVPFVLQRKSSPLFDYIGDLLAQKKEDEAIHTLSQVLDLVRESCGAGFVDCGDKIDKRYGCVDGRVILIRGNFIQNESLKTTSETLREVFRVGRSIESWLLQNYPGLVTRFQAEVQDVLTFIEEN